MKYHPSLWSYIKEEYVGIWHDVQADFSSGVDRAIKYGILGLVLVTIGAPVTICIMIWSWFEFRKLYTDEFINKL